MAAFVPAFPAINEGEEGATEMDARSIQEIVTRINADDSGFDARALAAAQAEIDAAELVATNHIADSTAAHDASAIAVTPSGLVTASTVAGAIGELEVLASAHEDALDELNGQTAPIFLDDDGAAYVLAADSTAPFSWTTITECQSGLISTGNAVRNYEFRGTLICTISADNTASQGIRLSMQLTDITVASGTADGCRVTTDWWRKGGDDADAYQKRTWLHGFTETATTDTVVAQWTFFRPDTYPMTAPNEWRPVRFVGEIDVPANVTSFKLSLCMAGETSASKTVTIRRATKLAVSDSWV